MIRAATLVVLLTAVAACGSDPVRPTSDVFTTLLPDGRYVVVVNTLAGRPGCSPLWEPDARAARSGTISIRREGSDWVGRPVSPSADDFELRIYSTGGTRVAGSIKGVLVTLRDDTRPGADGVALGASFGAMTSGGSFVSGDLPFGSSGHGRIEGRITFIDRTRDSMVCPDAEWGITPSLL